MNKELFVVLIRAGGKVGDRKTCEQIENTHIPLKGKERPIPQVIAYIEKEFDVKYNEDNYSDMLVYPITDFMDAVNDQEMDRELENYFMSYVYVTF